MSKLGMGLCWGLLRDGSLEAIRADVLTAEMFRGEARDAFEFILKHFQDHGVLPQRETLLNDVELDDGLVFEPTEPTSYYAVRVRERFCLNKQKEVARDLPEAVKERDPRQVHEIARNMVQVGLEILEASAGSLVDVNATGAERIAYYAELKAADAGILGIRSPWSPLDQETGGFKNEDLISIVARLGVGKTMCALVCAACARAQGKSVGIASLEMSRRAMQMRLDAIEFHLPYRDLLRGELDSETEQRYMDGLHTDRGLPPLFLATAGRVKNVADCEMFVQETGVNFLIVDGAYLLQEGGKNTPGHERLEMGVRGLKRLAQKRRIPVMQTQQFNRTAARGQGRTAGAENIRGSDATGMDSDLVLSLFQDDNMRAGSQMMLRVLKNREGPVIELAINWDLVLMEFGPLAGAAPRPVAQDDGDGGDGANGVLF